MARTKAVLSEGSRITDHISLGVISKYFPIDIINKALEKTDKADKRKRNMPGHVVIYYVIALALYMEVSYREVLRCLLEGIRWLNIANTEIKVTGKSGISQARKRVGSEPIKLLHDELIAPIAVNDNKQKTKGAWYNKWRLVSLDGSTLDVADTQENEDAFGRPKGGRGHSGFPQIRFVSLVENGSHVLFGSRMAGYSTGEKGLAKEVAGFLDKEMLCLADRGFYSYKFWEQCMSSGAELLWRVKKNFQLPCLRRFRDGSYLSRVYPSTKDKRHDRCGIDVRVVEYTLNAAINAEPIYRLITTILKPKDAPAKELAAIYHERWEIESAFDELKTHLRGAKIVLRSKRPDLVIQEFYGLLMAHYAIRGIMHQAALKGDIDPDKLSFVHSVRVIRRKLTAFAAFSPSGC